MKRIMCILFVMITFQMFAQKYQVAILEPHFESPDSTYAQFVKSIVKSELTKSITRTPGFESYTRSDLEQMQQEWAFQASGFVNDNQRVKLGEMTGVDYICLSKVMSYGDELIIDASLVNVETGEIIGSENQYVSVNSNASIAAEIGRACNLLGQGMIDVVKGQLESIRSRVVSDNKDEENEQSSTEMVKIPGSNLYVDKEDREAMVWAEAKDICSKSNARLPDVSELYMIYRLTLKDKYIFGSPFEKTSYWTSEKRNNFSAYSIDFLWGDKTYESVTSQSKFRCVRN